MQWVAAALIAVSSNLDNLTVGIALGLRPVRVSLVANAAIAMITMIGTAASMGGASALSANLPESVARMLGGLALIAIGVLVIVTDARALRATTAPGPRRSPGGPLVPLRDPLAAVAAHRPNASLSFRQALVLGVALALNNVAVGLPSGASGISVPLVTALTGFASLVCVGGGAALGFVFAGRFADRHAPILAGGILVAAGVFAAAR